jgi:hypothetical protein
MKHILEKTVWYAFLNRRNDFLGCLRRVEARHLPKKIHLNKNPVL